MTKLSWFLIFFVIPLHAAIPLDEMMTKQEMKETGINRLNYSQKMALQEWIHDNFEPKKTILQSKNEQLYLSLNIDEGAKIELSDGSLYEIAPEDRLYTMYWVTPFPIMLGRSDNPEYPTKLTNMNTNTSVSGKEVSTKEMLEEETKKQQKIPPPQIAPEEIPPQTSPQPNNSSPRKPQQPLQTQPQKKPPQPYPQTQQ